MLASKWSLSRSEATERAGLVGASAYRVELDFCRGQERFGFRVELDFEGRQPGATTYLDSEVARIETLEWNGSALRPDAEAGGRIALAELRAHNRVTVQGESTYDRDGLGMHLSVDPADGSTYIYSDLEPSEAHRCFPCFDQPDLKGTFQLRIRVPQDWLVVFAEPGSPGAVDEREGCRWWDFPVTIPLSVYVLGIAAGPFHQVLARHGQVPLGLYCPRSLAQYLDSEELFELTRQGLDYYEDAFAIPFPFSKYDQVFVPEKVNGAMESPGCVTITDMMLWRGRATPRQRSQRAELILHEMAHMWFGDLVTMRWWDDIWLNESFATLMAAFCQDRATKLPDAWVIFATTYMELAREEDQRATSHPVVTGVDEAEAVRANFDRITYEKGASALRQLVAWVGEECFFAALHTHLERHRAGNAEFGDLVQALEEASGRDVSGWAQSWLETVGVNTLELEVRGEPSADGERLDEVTVLQSAAESQPTLRQHQLQIGVFDWVGQALARVDQVQLEVQGARTPVPPLRGRPRPALLLPNDQSLTYAKIRLDAHSQETAERHLGAISEPLARALIWGSAWDRVCDAELPAHRFAAMVTTQAARESDPSLLTTVLGNARYAIRRYGAPRRAAELEAGLAEEIAEQLAESQPGSDRQTVCLRAFISVATTPDQVGRLRAWLDGRELPAGVALDPELVWHLVSSLAARGAAGEPDLARALGLDPSSTGRTRVAAARAAMPTSEAKQRAWALMTSADATIEESRLVAIGFAGVRQESLVAAYFPRLRRDLAQLWEVRGAEYTIELGQWLPLSLHPDRTLAEESRQGAADPQLHPDVRRIFASLLDDTERGLRARRLDEQPDTGWAERLPSRHPDGEAIDQPVA
ncbi:MAG: aminopeptidase N [Candidatus Dormibacteria bacterium]